VLVSVMAPLLAVGAVATCTLGFKYARSNLSVYWVGSLLIATCISVVSRAPWWVLVIDLGLLSGMAVHWARNARREKQHT
jgi:hypothetical protein